MLQRLRACVQHSHSRRDINVSRSPGKFFQSTIYIHARTPFAAREPLRVVMFVINFQCRPLRDTVDVPCFNYDGKGWTVHSRQIVLCVFRSFAIGYLMFIKGIFWCIYVRFATLADNNLNARCNTFNIIHTNDFTQLQLHFKIKITRAIFSPFEKMNFVLSLPAIFSYIPLLYSFWKKKFL